jgi:hypothetical protein
VRQYTVPLVVVAALTFGVAGVVAWQVERENRERAEASLERAEASLERIEAGKQRAEAAARSLVDGLGSFCAGFDFYYKHDMANGAFRPVRCSPVGRDETVLVAYGFDSTRTQSAWVSEWGELAGQRGVTLVEKGRWAVEVIDSRIVEDIRGIMLAFP